MGLDLTFSAGGNSFTRRLGPAEVRGIEALREQLPREARVLFGVEHLGTPTKTDPNDVIEATKTALGAIKDGTIAFGVTYYLESQWGTTYTGGNFSIGGVPHAIHVGVDSCTLQELVRGDDGLYLPGPPKDIRSLATIMTDQGEVLIRRKVKPTSLSKLLREIQRFAKDHSTDTLTKIVG